MNRFVCLMGMAGIMLAATLAPARVVTYPAPAGTLPSADYAVTADGRPVFVYTVGTLNHGPASFASFDFEGSAEVAITVPRSDAQVTIRPASFGITPRVEGDVIRFTLTRPRNLTVEVNGPTRALHLFANPIERDAPKPGDPGVVYFGPGLHEVTTMTLASGSTLYLAGGAVLRCVLGAGERPTRMKDWSGVKNYRPFMVLHGLQNVKIRGRGTIDMRALSWHARSGIVLQGAKGIEIEGITLLDAPAWAMSMFNSSDVHIDNIKQICARENSDGIDICNSRDVTVENCFMRNNDDEICVKTTMGAPAPASEHITVRRCVIWNERARGLGITSETRRDINDVLFQDCDIIHDFSKGGDCASLAILVSDSGTMRNIRFEDIRVEDVKTTLIRCWVGHDMWGHDAERGRVEGVLFKNITVGGAVFPRSDLLGCDEGHLIQNVTFEKVRIQGKPVSNAAAGKIQMNPFVRNVKFVP